ncbi:AAA family ATPase [Candidatus Parabeggiatoa sp. HSG14]|uniref:WD40 domain-containing protein n=1 Tax=Candidatus Parabeggiatoa sp. HSG14 TaxID=3055593 RepID=UPI0025A8A2C0|nr:AAA family ATPase [Thiotrichales bacterium HSG14]
MNNHLLFGIIHYVRQLIQLLGCIYLMLLTFDVMAIPIQSSSMSEIEKHLTRLDKKSGITSVTFSHDGRFLACGSEDNKVYLWNANSGQLLKTFEGHTQSVTSVNFSADGKKLVSGSKDKTIRLWDIGSQTFLDVFEGHSNTVNSVVFHPDGNILASSSNGGEIRLWNIYSKKLIRKPLQWTTRYIQALAFSPDGKMMAAGSSDLKVRVWKVHVQNAKPLKIYERLKCSKYQHIVSLDFSPNSQMLAAGFNKGMVCIWDTQTRKLLKRLYTSKTDIASSITFRADGELLAYNHYQTIYLWKTDTNESTQLLTVPGDSYIWEMKFNPNSNSKNVLAYTSSDGTVRLWDIENNSLLGTFAINTDNRWVSCIEKYCLCSGQLCSPIIEAKQIEDEKINKASREDKSPNMSVRKDGKNEPPITSQNLITDVAKTGDNISTQPASPNNMFYITIYFLIALLFLMVISIIIVLFYRRVISRQNADLLNIPLSQLSQKRHLLKRTRCLDHILATNNVSQEDLDKAVAFVEKMSPIERSDLLATRLNAKQWEQMDTELFRVIMRESFPLNLPFFSLYLPTSEKTNADILTKLHECQDMSTEKIVAITSNTEQQQMLRDHVKEQTLSWIVPDDTELTGLLLSSDPMQTFAQTLSEQTNVTHISPYQTRSGVNKNAGFFGRTQILSLIFNRDPANYLIMGGRQLGKSSLLKYIHRHYQNHPQLQCRYLTLHSDNLQRQLAVTLGLSSDSSLKEVLAQLTEIASKQPQLLLIDQADHFVQTEMKNGYRTLNYFRSLSEEGHCHFILAGFWELYQASVLDYQSPLKNFGESLTIAELEADACRDLAVKPMQMMNLRYASEEIVENLIRETGQRANLMSIVCHELLKSLTSNHRRVFENEDIAQAFNSEAVRESLKGWGMLSDDEQDNYLDRIIVYATVKNDQFNVEELTNVLETHGCTHTLEQINQSLDRLALSFIIKRESPGHYRYGVPLFRQMLLKEQNVEKSLQWELKEMS